MPNHPDPRVGGLRRPRVVLTDRDEIPEAVGERRDGRLLVRLAAPAACADGWRRDDVPAVTPDVQAWPERACAVGDRGAGVPKPVARAAARRLDARGPRPGVYRASSRRRDIEAVVSVDVEHDEARHGARADREVGVRPAQPHRLLIARSSVVAPWRPLEVSGALPLRRTRAFHVLSAAARRRGWRSCRISREIAVRSSGGRGADDHRGVA